ncbi:flagellar hook protein FlgE [Chitinilyticum piscinae]|uniref:Flagellar hook protein FlgE n=1 Tax=Chitinilyticum piscinae TaxID=2866724 RepID=A0A8J7FR50_9NEIS|nr:flagellar hook protein FlgE [Chitinilyticum piscinae]MBE9610769.1 flagellar hook protein FlgE [Chitinilyticum piscinae]
MGFQQGLSGLNASSKNLDVIGNNVANSQTVGFKGSRAEFADIYASTFGTASNVAGIGTRVSTIAQQFGQGNLTTTNNPLDIAITGNGFFRMQGSAGDVSYSRNGQFQVTKDGYIVNGGNKQFLTGWPVDKASGLFLEGSMPQPIQLQYSNIGAQETGGSGVTGAGLSLGINLNAKDKVINSPTNPIPGPAFSSSDPTTYNYSTSATVYDSLGVSHTQTFYFRKQDPAGGGAVNAWDVYYTLDGKTVNQNGSLGPGGTMLRGSLTFDQNGQYTGYTSNLTAGTRPPVPATNSSWFSVEAGATGLNNGSDGLNFELFFDKSTQFGSPYTLNSLTQDGYTDGVLTGISVSDDGVVQGRYSNGETRNVAKVVLATFINNQGLQPVGDNLWVESYASGQPLLNAPGAGSTGQLQAATVEDSNVDLTAELVNMIVAQRTYQANAKTISAQDAILQTLVNI